MSVRKLTGFLEKHAPQAVRRTWQRLLVDRYMRKLNLADSLRKKVAIATGRTVFRSNQRPSEVLGLLEQLDALKPRTVCEIGCDRGGTLSLFAQIAAPQALIVSIDPVHAGDRTRAFQQFARLGQRIVRIAGDSHAPQTLGKLRDVLQGRPLDFLFIDGDHSYDGVAQDYQMYAPLLRTGGMLAFHDIVPDTAARTHGDETSPSWAGGVPQFFRTVICSRHVTRSFVEDSRQDGFGIGLVRWDRSQTTGPIGTEWSVTRSLGGFAHA